MSSHWMQAARDACEALDVYGGQFEDGERSNDERGFAMIQLLGYSAVARSMLALAEELEGIRVNMPDGLTR